MAISRLRQCLERRAAGIAHQHMIDVRILQCHGGGMRSLVGKPVARWRNAAAVARHRGKGEEATVLASEMARRGDGDRRTVETAAEMAAERTDRAQAAAYRFVEMRTERLDISRIGAELDTARQIERPIAPKFASVRGDCQTVAGRNAHHVA